MLVLGLDTSTPAVTVALVDLMDETNAIPGDGLSPLAERTVVDGRRHGETLSPLVAEVLEAAGVTTRELRALVVGVGPGPFTGLRVGIVTAAALSDALGIPAYPVCSLDALMSQAWSEHEVAEAVVISDARRKEVYWRRYKQGGLPASEPSVERPAGLAERLLAEPRPPALVGPAVPLYAELFTPLATTPLQLSAIHLFAPTAAAITSGEAPGPLRPLYLRRPDAVEPGAAKTVTA